MPLGKVRVQERPRMLQVCGTGVIPAAHHHPDALRSLFMVPEQEPPSGSERLRKADFLALVPVTVFQFRDVTHESFEFQNQTLAYLLFKVL